MEKHKDIKIIYTNPLSEIEQTEKYWNSLLSNHKHHYFLSWGWIHSWLESLQGKFDIRFVVCLKDDQPVVGFFIGLSSIKKYEIFSLRSISLNTTGNHYFDQLFLEYNEVLADDLFFSDIKDFLEVLSDIKWDVIYLPGVSSAFAEKIGLLKLETNSYYNVLLEEQSTSYLVNLERVRDARMDYLKLLSSNRRSQIRRSIKEYEKEGDITIVEAENLTEALRFFDELVFLHQKEWESRGKAGAFSNQYLLQFHKSLIQERFLYGEIQLLKCSTNKDTIGVLYNFVYQDRVYFYQSGFNYPIGNLYRPGLVSHYYAILLNAQKGKDMYDFMTGGDTYKSSLSTDTQTLYWFKIFRHPFYYKIATFIQKIIFWVRATPLIYTWLNKAKALIKGF